MAVAQEVTSISGTVVDGDTGETLPFVQIYFLKSTTNKGMIASEVGTTSDIDGNHNQQQRRLHHAELPDVGLQDGDADPAQRAEPEERESQTDAGRVRFAGHCSDTEEPQA